VGLPSSGPHTNGFSLIQRLFASEEYEAYVPELGVTLGEALLAPHRCYLAEIQALLTTGAVRGLAHITGGGIAGNLSRILPAGLQAVVELPPPGPLFELIGRRGVSPQEMRRVFNLGIGMVAVVSDQTVAAARGTEAPWLQPRISSQFSGVGWLPLGGVERSADTERKVIFRERG
jgi:phosphoribosylformylglycinamidine cyclo-ligase